MPSSISHADIEDAVLARAVDTIRGNLARQVSRGKIAEGEPEAAVARIATTTDYASFAREAGVIGGCGDPRDGGFGLALGDFAARDLAREIAADGVDGSR